MTSTTTAYAIRTQADEDAARPKSVVNASYKHRYAERAIAARGKKGVDKRVVADSNGDWLALELAAMLRPTKRSRTDLDLFMAILDANGVDYSRLPVGTPNWQGRFRMNGGQMLRTAVAEADGELVVPAFDGRYMQSDAETTLTAPRAWVKRYAGA